MKNIFGKKYSIQRLLIIGFVLAVSFVIILTVSEFFIFIEPAVKKNNLIIIESQSEFNAIVYILRKIFTSKEQKEEKRIEKERIRRNRRGNH